MAPPATYAPVMRGISALAFDRGTVPQGLRISGRKKWCALAWVDFTGVGPLTVSARFFTPGSVDLGGGVPLTGTGEILGDPLWTLSRLFSKYKVHRFCIEYAPRSATITPLSFVMAYTPDPNWCQDRGVTAIVNGSRLVYLPSEYAVSQLTNAVQLPVWSPTVCMDLSSQVPKKEFFTTGEDNYGFTNGESSVSYASLRQNTNFGTVVFAGDENVGATAGVFGDLFIRYDLEYWDMGPTVQVSNPYPPPAPLGDVVGSKTDKEPEIGDSKSKPTRLPLSIKRG